MPKFISLFSGVPTDAKEVPDTDQVWEEWITGLRQKGIYHSGWALRMEGTTITPQGTIQFTPNEATIGGYAIVDAADLPTATEIAQTAPHSIRGGRTEIRPGRDAA